MDVSRDSGASVDARRAGPELGGTGSLPAELLVEIFRLLPFWDRVRTAIVCRRWRSVSLGAAGQLWSTLVGPGDVVVPRDLGACRGLLDRARRTLVTFVVRDMHEGNFKEIGEMLLDHLPHMKALDITLLPHPRGSWELTPRVVRGISSALRAKAPVLESIRIANRVGMKIDGLTILRGPKLSSIELHGLDLSCLQQCGGSRTLRSLVVSTNTTSWKSTFSWSLICSFPLLETLAISIAVPDIDDVSAQRCHFPTSMKRLSLSLPQDMLSTLTYPGDFSRLDQWHLSFINAGATQLADLATVMPYLQNINPSTAAVQFDGRLMHLMLQDVNGRRGTVQTLRFDADWSRPLAAATKLCIGGLGIIPGQVTTAASIFPSLEDLTLDVTPESRSFASSTIKWPRLACPSLRTVLLRSAKSTRTIPLAALSSFLRDSLDAGPAKIAALVLHGVHISGPPGGDVLGTLHDLAEKVNIIDTGGPWTECHLAWNRPLGEVWL